MLQRLQQDAHEVSVQARDLLRREKLRQEVIIHAEAASVRQTGEVDAQLLGLIAAVMPAAREGNGGVGAFQDLAALEGKRNAEKPRKGGILPPRDGGNFLKGQTLMAQKLIPALAKGAVEFRKRLIFVNFD